MSLNGSLSERAQQAIETADRQVVRLPNGHRVPLQKPLRAQHFTGRELELARLLAELGPGKQLTLCGPGGIGKTALAAEAVWRLAPGDEAPERFPDGVVFHTFHKQPQAGLALEALARAYGVDPRPIAADGARLALAGRRALLILDGAEAADDLQAVLQVVGTCGVLLITRRAGAAQEIQELAPLPEPESLGLLRAYAPACADDAATAKELVALLGGLPLALVLAGSCLASRKQKSQEYAAWLEAQGLAALPFDARPSKCIPLVLQRSLEQVSATAQAAFAVTGALALAPFDAEPVAAALGEPVDAALRELVDYGLLRRLDGRCQATHALVHGYAREQVAPPAEAVGRLALYFAALAQAEGQRRQPDFAVLDGQRAHMVAVQAAALAAGQWEAVQGITWKVEDYLDRNGCWTQRVAVLQAGIDAARATGNSHAGNAFLNGLGLAYAALGEARRAIDLFEQLLTSERESGNRGGECRTLGNLANVYASQGETRRAIQLYEQQVAIEREIGGGSDVLSNLGLAYADLGETQRAIELFEQQVAIDSNYGCGLESADLGNLGNAYADLGETRSAIDLYEQQLMTVREFHDRDGEGRALNNLGLAVAALGEISRAVELYEQRLVIARELGDRRGEAVTSWNLGLAYEQEGDLERAVATMQLCVDYEEAVGHPDAAADAQYVADIRQRAGL